MMGERPRPVGQAGQIPAADVPLDLSAQLPDLTVPITAYVSPG
jgi:hypothetical protein